MSEIQNLANAIRATASKTTLYIRTALEADQALKKAQILAASTTHGRAVSAQITSLKADLKGILDSLETFDKGAHEFADSLAYGQGGNGRASVTTGLSTLPSLSTVAVGAHMGIKENYSNGFSVVTRHDPETNSTLSWGVDDSGRTYSAHATLRGISSEKRTNNEVRTASRVGRLTRETHNDDNGLGHDDGGHLLAAVFAGSNGAINIVPQNFDFNQKVYWNKFEKNIKNLLEQGYEVDVSVSLDYKNKDTVRPDTFAVSYIAKHPNKNTKMLNRVFHNVHGGGENDG